jgi:hypothetical protein
MGHILRWNCLLKHITEGNIEGRIEMTGRREKRRMQLPDSLNPFQSNFSANRILPSSYLFWAVKRLVDYLQLSYSFKREKHGETERVQPALSVG